MAVATIQLISTEAPGARSSSAEKDLDRKCNSNHRIARLRNSIFNMDLLWHFQLKYLRCDGLVSATVPAEVQSIAAH